MTVINGGIVDDSPQPDEAGAESIYISTQTRCSIDLLRNLQTKVPILCIAGKLMQLIDGFVRSLLHVGIVSRWLHAVGTRRSALLRISALL